MTLTQAIEYGSFVRAIAESNNTQEEKLRQLKVLEAEHKNG